MFWRKASVVELDAIEVQARLSRGAVVLVDVREAREYDAERIEGAISMPLSQFDPAALPGDPARIVFHCLSGGRSATAVSRCRAAGIAADQHMRGGITAWKTAGLPTRR